MNDSSADWLYQTLLFADDNLLRPPRLPPGVILPVEAARGLLCFLDPKGLEVSQIEADWEPHRGASHRWRRGGKQPLPDRLVGEGCHGLNLGEASPHPCREQAPDRSAQPRAGPTSSFLMILVAHLQSITTTVAWRIAISSVVQKTRCSNSLLLAALWLIALWLLKVMQVQWWCSSISYLQFQLTL